MAILLQFIPQTAPKKFKAERETYFLKVYYNDQLFFTLTNSAGITNENLKDLLNRCTVMSYMSVSDCCDIMSSIEGEYDVEI